MNVKNFSKLTLSTFLLAIILFVLFYIFGIIIATTYFGGSISGKSTFGVILGIFGYYLPIILFLATLLLLFVNFFVNNPHNHNLSLGHLFFGLSIITVVITSYLAMFLVAFGLSLIVIVLNSIFPILSIIYGYKAKIEMEEWSTQYWIIFVLCAIIILASLVIYGLLIFNPPISM